VSKTERKHAIIMSPPVHGEWEWLHAIITVGRLLELLHRNSNLDPIDHQMINYGIWLPPTFLSQLHYLLYGPCRSSLEGFCSIGCGCARVEVMLIRRWFAAMVLEQLGSYWSWLDLQYHPWHCSRLSGCTFQNYCTSLLAIITASKVGAPQATPAGFISIFYFYIGPHASEPAAPANCIL
jgi:hypothetical protein